MTTPGAAPPSAVDRIIVSGRELAVSRGVGAVSLAEVAAAAGVSKALIHYHFADRGALLRRVVESLAARTLDRQRGALGATDVRLETDRLWRWLSDELRRGEIRALLAFGDLPETEVKEAVRAAASSRRAACERTTQELFGLLGLRGRVPAPMMGSVLLTFVNGLALSVDRDQVDDARVQFDVFWLAMLGLAE